MSLRLAINGFGRIGRATFKIALEKEGVEIVALNDLTDNKTLAHLLKYDTAYGRYDKEVTANDTGITVDGKEYTVLAEKDPAKLPWKEMKVDVVIESTGRFRTLEEAQGHITAGAEKVLISAPAKGDGVDTFVMGVNNADYKDQQVVSNASCTTNCIAPPAQVMSQAFGIQKAMMTTIHSYTADQNIVDGPHSDLRRARAAAANIVPTSTGAATATAKTIPELKGVFDGIAVRVPTLIGSLTDFTMLLKKKVTEEEVIEAFEAAVQEERYRDILEITHDPIVSSDIVGNPHSSIVDLGMTKVVDGDLVKIVAWYDNEWGYSNSLIRMALQVAGTK